MTAGTAGSRSSGADIPITSGTGRYTISFDDQTKRYTVAKEPPS
jgi:hypothetical protein